MKKKTHFIHAERRKNQFDEEKIGVPFDWVASNATHFDYVLIYT